MKSHNRHNDPACGFNSKWSICAIAAAFFLSLALPLSAQSQTLTFRTGFEPNTTLRPVAQLNCYATGCMQFIDGMDLSTGFTWPGSNGWPGSGGPTHALFQIHADHAVDATTIQDYAFNQIVNVTGPNGTPTNVLYSQISQSGCCGVNPQEGSTQNAFQFQPASELGDHYISHWIKFQPDLVQRMAPSEPGGTGHWRALFEWKTGSTREDCGGACDDGDYRIMVELVTWNTDNPLQWYVFGDNVATSGQTPADRRIYWEKYKLVNPATVDAFNLGQWMKFEVFWHRSGDFYNDTGRVWVAVNGEVIADISSSATPREFDCPVPSIAPNPPNPTNPPDCHLSMMGPNNLPINRVMVHQLYSSTAYPIYQWVDDLQVWWDGFPVDATVPH